MVQFDFNPQWPKWSATWVIQSPLVWHMSNILHTSPTMAQSLMCRHLHVLVRGSTCSKPLSTDVTYGISFQCLDGSLHDCYTLMLCHLDTCLSSNIFLYCRKCFRLSWILSLIPLSPSLNMSWLDCQWIRTLHKNPSVLQENKGELVFWWGHLINIWFLKPNFMKYDNQILIWKIILLSCTLN